MLGDAHGIEDHGPGGRGVPSGRLHEFFPGDAGDAFHALGRILPGHLPHLLKALGVLLNEPSVVEPFGNDHIDHAVDPGDVGAGAVGKVQVGDPGHRHLAGVDDHQPGALAQGAHHVGGDHRVLFRGVGPRNEDEVGVFNFLNGVGHGAGPEGAGEAGHGGGVAQSGAVVHMVGADHGAGEAHQHIVVFVGTLSGAEHGDGFGTVAGLNFGEFFGHEVQGFGPGGAAQTLAGTDQGILQAIGVLGELIAAPAFEAESAAGNGVTAGGHHPHNPTVAHPQVEHASGAAPDAGGVNPPFLQRHSALF